jgi:hypothetical protein
MRRVRPRLRLGTFAVARQQDEDFHTEQAQQNPAVYGLWRALLEESQHVRRQQMPNRKPRWTWEGPQTC